jgi:xanthine dehydrogenase YagR molybdenum-binding subunit
MVGMPSLPLPSIPLSRRDLLIVEATSVVKAEGVGEPGLTGVAPAVADAVYNATGVRVRDYPITLDKHLDRLPGLT